jgi:predicted DNA-binding WGR domain protein
MTTRYIYMEKRVPDKNQYRFYAMHVVCTLFGDWALMREWGRIGSPGTVRENWFDSQKEAIDAMFELSKSKQKKGYIEIHREKRN